MRESHTALLSIATSQAMHALGERLGAAFAVAGTQPLVVTLSGDLGAGKTTLVRGVLSAFGVQGPMRSPTYTLIEPYESSGRSIYHLDLYRVTHPGEVEELGVRDLLEGNALLLIEWAEKGAGALPGADLQVRIGYTQMNDSARSVALIASAALGDSLTHLLSVECQQT